MTRQGWAERKVAQATTGYSWNARIRKSTVILPSIAAKLLLAEHRRAVRVVKQEIVATEKLRDTALRADNVAAEAVYLDTIVALNKALAALQKGRT
jgi:hypothetical protein